jgi:hypothetical protein
MANAGNLESTLEFLQIKPARARPRRTEGKGKREPLVLGSPSRLPRQGRGSAQRHHRGRDAGDRGIPSRTFIRRKGKDLARDESDRVLRAARITRLALSVFEHEAKTKEWLTTPNPVLGNARPIDLCRTDQGANDVEQELGPHRMG